MEAVVVLFDVLSWYLPECANEHHNIPQSRHAIYELRFELGTSPIWSSGATHSRTTFDVIYIGH
jgi:hypothetical protein